MRTIWRAPTNASKWRMGFNSAFKGLNPSAQGQRGLLRFTRISILSWCRWLLLRFKTFQIQSNGTFGKIIPTVDAFILRLQFILQVHTFCQKINSNHSLKLDVCYALLHSLSLYHMLKDCGCYRIKKKKLNNPEITIRIIHNHKFFVTIFIQNPKYTFSKKQLFLYASFIKLHQKHFQCVPECHQDLNLLKPSGFFTYHKV